MSLLRSLCLSAALLGTLVAAHAESWPTRPLRLVIPFPAGGPTDTLGRAVAQRMSQNLGQQVVVENRSGAGGTLGSAEVSRAAPDGYTLLMGTSSTHSIAPHLNAKLPYDAETDFVAIAHLATSPNVLLVPAGLPVRTAREFIAYAKARPGQLNYASSGNGTTLHIIGEAFKAQAGVYLAHIPYRGSALAMTDLKAGSVHAIFDSIVSGLPHTRDGSVRALAVTSAKRSPLAPELPTLAETLPGFESTTWFGIFAPRGLPSSLTARLNAEFNRALQASDVQERLARVGAEAAAPHSAEQFAELVRQQSARFGKLIRERKIHSD